MSDYLNNPEKVHSDILNALKAIAILVVPAIGLFLFNIAIYSYKNAYFQTFNLPFIPLESSLWLDIIQNETLVILLLTLLFFAIGFIVGGIFLFRHSFEKIKQQEFSWPIFLATFLLLSPFIFSLHGISLKTQIMMILIYAFLIPFLFTRHFHLFIFKIRNLHPKRRKQVQTKEEIVLHDISFITFGITYLFIVFILFVLLMESVAERLGQFHAKEKVAVMISPAFKDLPEHIRVDGTSLYLEGCDYKKCLGYEPIRHKDDTIIHPKFFGVNDIQFINPEIIQTFED